MQKTVFGILGILIFLLIMGCTDQPPLTGECQVSNCSGSIECDTENIMPCEIITLPDNPTNMCRGLASCGFFEGVCRIMDSEEYYACLENALSLDNPCDHEIHAWGTCFDTTVGGIQFNAQTNSCEQIMSGGCGIYSPFESIESCEASCVTGAPATCDTDTDCFSTPNPNQCNGFPRCHQGACEFYCPTDPCEESFRSWGSCEALISGFSYNTATNACEELSEGGCAAFIPFTALEQCETQCILPVIE